MFSFVGKVLGGALGFTFSLIVLALMALAVPLNVISIMHILHWEWWAALLGAIALAGIPVVGQLPFFAFVFYGAFLLVDAGFDWRIATGDRPTAVPSIPADFASYKQDVLLPMFVDQCENLGQQRFGGYSTALALRCRCVARVLVRDLSFDEVKYAVAHPDAFLPGHEEAVKRECP